MATLEYEINKITEVKDAGDSMEIRMGSSCFLLEKEHGVEPKAGDKIELYGGLGRPIRGVCINGKTAYFKGELQMEREHKEWVKKTADEHAVAYRKLMKEIKDELERETVDVSGMGGGYERACQLMIFAGIEYLKDKPDFVFDYKSFKQVYGITWSDSEHSKRLDKALMKAVDGDSSGAMHQCVIGHLAFIHKNSERKWLDQFPKEHRYIYPKGLPEPSFGKR